MKLLFIFIFQFSYFTSSCLAQQSIIDSVLILLQKDKKDTNKIIHLNALCWEYRNIGKYDSALYYGIAELQLANEIADKTTQLSIKQAAQKGIASSYTNIGSVYWSKGNYDKAIENYFSSLKIYEQLNNKKGIAVAYNNLGAIYFSQGNYTKALGSHLDALKIRKEIGDNKGIATSYNNIGIIYHSQNNLNKALENYSASVKIKKEIGDKQGIAATYNNIGTIYKELANLHKSPDSIRYMMDKALENITASFKISEEIGDKKNLAFCHHNFGSFYLQKSKSNFLSSRKKIELQAEARKHSLLSLNMAKEIGSNNDIKEAYLILSICDSIVENWKGAYEYRQLYSDIKDSIFSEESSRQITEMSTKYETEKKEQQIKLLNKDKEIQAKDLARQKTIRNAVAGGLFLVLLFSFVLINRLLLIRKQKKVIEVEREKSEKLLLNILPKETADELKLHNRVAPKFYDQVTVMFTDFKGFTTIAEKMSAEELVNELDFIFKKFDEIISKYPIEKIKTIGDAYMCAGGLPVANTSNPMDVVMAALEICEFMKSRQEAVAVGSKEKGLLLPSTTANWQIRIGVHTGSVIAGVVGDKKFAYDIWGDTVNIASRMESSGEPTKVNISGSTYTLIKDKLQTTNYQLQTIFRGKIPAKNKGEIEMYFVEKK